MKNYTIIFTAILALFIAACAKIEQTNQTPNTTNPVNQTNQTETETNTAQPSVGPTETLKALNEAGKKKDLTAVKSYFSQASLALFEEEARAQNKTIDEFLAEREYEELPAIQGERIEGDIAVVEIKDPKSNLVEEIPLIKENGQWKLAFDLYLESLNEQLEESNKSEQKK